MALASSTGTDNEGIVYQRWDQFARWFRSAWTPGQHITMVAPTGEGKTTLGYGLMAMRRYVVALDIKGGDETLAAFGYRRIPVWPGKRKFIRMVREDERQHRPSRYVVGLPVIDSREAKVKQHRSIAACLNDLYELGRVTLYNDELQVTCDQRMMNLSGAYANILVAARSRRLSAVQSAQGDSWIIGEAKTQPSWLAIGHTMNRTMQTDLAKLTGRSVPSIRGLINALPRHCWAIAGRNPREPVVITCPPYLAPKVASN